MSWRTVYIASQCHLSFKNNYLVIRADDVKQIHLSEINTLIIDTTMSTMSVYVMNELIKAKVKVIICDEKHNPSMELTPYYAAYNSSKMVSKEVNWQLENCGEIWKKIVRYKIFYQARILDYANKDTSQKLTSYIDQIEIDDVTNREGHAAKVYFNSLFGSEFSRDDDNNINAYLDYGYTILLSMFNREIANNGYITQIGIHHRGPTNPFNLSCDFMEPFRPIIDKFAYDNQEVYFGKNAKLDLINMTNKQLLYQGKKMYLTNIIAIYVAKLLAGIENGGIDDQWFEYSEV